MATFGIALPLMSSAAADNVAEELTCTEVGPVTTTFHGMTLNVSVPVMLPVRARICTAPGQGSTFPDASTAAIAGVPLVQTEVAPGMTAPLASSPGCWQDRLPHYDVGCRRGNVNARDSLRKSRCSKCRQKRQPEKRDR